MDTGFVTFSLVPVDFQAVTDTSLPTRLYTADQHP